MAEPYVKNLPDGTKLQGGKYEIVRFINSGGFGCTYEARFPMMRSRVAIKEFFMGKYCVRDQRTGMVSTATEENCVIVDKCRQKFVDEASTLYGMSHRSIVRVSDIFEENGTAYFAMDYISGRTLAEIVRDEGPMPEQKAIDCMRQICDALQYLHGNHRLHLDIKPDNIMIDDTGRAVLIDFGASKYLDNVSTEERRVTSNVVQTPGYSPNEQLTGDVSRFTNATDLYALGATLYFVLSGVTPVSATLRSAGEDLEPLPTSVSESTRDVVYKAMRLMKKERPQTAQEFSDMLKDVPEPNEEAPLIEVEAEKPSAPKPAYEPDRKTEPIFTRPVEKPSVEKKTSVERNSPFEVKKPSVFDIPQGGKNRKADKPANPSFDKPSKPKPAAESSGGGNRKMIMGIGAVASVILVAVIVMLSHGRGDKSLDDGDTLLLANEDSVYVEEITDTAYVQEVVEPEQTAEAEIKPEVEPIAVAEPVQPIAQKPVKHSKQDGQQTAHEKTETQEPQRQPSPEQLMADELRSALKISDLKSRQKALMALAGKGYAPSYAPLASVSVLLRDDANADKYARLAIQHGHASEVQAVVKALDNQGYYDSPVHGKKPL